MHPFMGYYCMDVQARRSKPPVPICTRSPKVPEAPRVEGAATSTSCILFIKSNGEIRHIKGKIKYYNEKKKKLQTVNRRNLREP